MRFAPILLIDPLIFGTLNQRVPGSSPGAHSPCKPRVSGTTRNSAFLRGFPTTHFPDFCLCERSPILVAVFNGLSPHPKIPFPAAGLGRESDRTWRCNSAFCAAVIQGPGSARQLSRIESERLKLPAPFGWRIAEPVDTDAAGQAAFYCRFDKIGREEGE